MNDKEKHIEEMAKVSGGCDYPHRPCEKCWCKEKNECSAYSYAKSFYEQGYRKIPEDSVVLSREEKQEYEGLVKLLIYDKPIKSRVYEFIKEIKEQARKETAEKILNELLRLNLGTTTIKVSSNHNKEDIKIACQAVIDLIKDKLKEIATREGVEIKE